MADYFEVDFLSVHTAKSGDAIGIRYEFTGQTAIHVVDGGYQSTGPKFVEHIKKYYGNPTIIDHVVVTHPDQDHAEGIQAIIEAFPVGALWMLCPWNYAAELLPRFTRYSSAENLAKRFRDAYPYIDALEKLALKKGVPMFEPFQGKRIGAFTVLAPSRSRYLDLIVASDKTPEGANAAGGLGILSGLFAEAAKAAVRLAKVAWGAEIFSEEETSVENEMSVVQFASLCGQRIVLTADAGRGALTEASAYAPFAGLFLPGVDRFQVPHHGGRRNVSTELLDAWLGSRLSQKLPEGSEQFTAVISSAKEDTDHPRKSVVRAMIHRGAKVVTTETSDIRTSHNAPDRDGWSAAPLTPYPEDQEET